MKFTEQDRNNLDAVYSRVMNGLSSNVEETAHYPNVVIAPNYATSLSSVVVIWGSVANGILWLAIGY